MASGNVVVIGIDNSADAEYAFDYYMENVHVPSNYVLLIHAPDVPIITGSEAMMLSDDFWTQKYGKLRTEIKQLNDKYVEKMKAHKANGEFKTELGTPGKALDEVAVSRDAVLIVVGTRGQSPLKQALTGSTSRFLLHHGSKPVLVCKNFSKAA